MHLPAEECSMLLKMPLWKKPFGNTSQHKQNIRSKTEPPAKKRKKESIEIVAIISSDEEDEVVPLDMQTWIAELDLNQKDKTELETGGWLSDKQGTQIPIRLSPIFRADPSMVA